MSGASELKPDRSHSATSVKSYEAIPPLVSVSVPLVSVRPRTELDLQPFFALSISTSENSSEVDWQLNFTEEPKSPSVFHGDFPIRLT